jgi:hypothetical protein
MKSHHLIRRAFALAAIAGLLLAVAASGRAHQHEGLYSRPCHVCQVAKAPVLDFAPDAALELPAFFAWHAHAPEPAFPSGPLSLTGPSRAPPA